MVARINAILLCAVRITVVSIRLPKRLLLYGLHKEMYRGAGGCGANRDGCFDHVINISPPYTCVLSPYWLGDRRGALWGVSLYTDLLFSSLAPTAIVGLILDSGSAMKMKELGTGYIKIRIRNRSTGDDGKTGMAASKESN